MKKFPFLALFSLLILVQTPNTVYAVPPPDFLFNLGSSIAQTFSVVVLFLSAIFGVAYKYIQTKLILLKSRTILFLSLSLIIIAGISIGSAYLYGNYKQDKEYKTWLEESNKYAQLPKEQEEYLKKKKIPRDVEKKNGENTIDQLTIGETKKVKTKIKRAAESEEKFIANIENYDSPKNTEFIKDYYQAIALGDFEKAYNMSKKSVKFETFKSWYNKTTKITLDQVSIIDERKLSWELTLYEGNNYTRYGVLADLKIENGNPVQIINSDIRILSEGTVVVQNDTKITKTAPEESSVTSDFFEKNKNIPLSISNKNFQKVLNENEDNYVILDARENLEYENGYLPESMHIRYADLQAGEWIKLPTSKFVYVLCWSGIRGKEVATYLREKNIVAAYLENGANGWVEFGGKWIGNIKFAEKYTEDKYKKLFSTSQIKDKVEEGVFLIDSRQPWKFAKWHIPESVNIPVMYTPTINLEEAFNQVPKNSTVITICDDYVNCFDAKITAVELENRDHTFIGRYNKPWEYQ